MNEGEFWMACHAVPLMSEIERETVIKYYQILRKKSGVDFRFKVFGLLSYEFYLEGVSEVLVLTAHYSRFISRFDYIFTMHKDIKRQCGTCIREKVIHGSFEYDIEEAWDNFFEEHAKEAMKYDLLKGFVKDPPARTIKKVWKKK